MAKRMAHLRPSLSLAALASADLVIEAVFEDMAVKQALLRELDPLLRKARCWHRTLLISTPRPHGRSHQSTCQRAGPAFLRPAGHAPSGNRGGDYCAHVLATALAIGKQIGKVSVVARVSEGSSATASIPPTGFSANSCWKGAYPDGSE